MRVNIHYKIALIFIIVIAIVLLGVYFYLTKHLEEFTYRRIKTNVTKQIALSKTYLEAKSSENITAYNLDAAADIIGRDLDLRVTIVGLDGTVYGDSELKGDALANVENHLYRPEIQQAIKSGIGESRRFSTTVKKDMLYVASTYGKEIPQGIIRLSIPLLEVEQISDHLKKILIAGLLIAFILAIIISFLASGFISKPIRSMSLAAQGIAHGNFSKRVTDMSNDEIGDLAKAFNFMTEQIRTRIEEVTTNKSRLEAVLLSMFEGVMVVDISGTILLMNQTLKDFLLVKEEPIGKRPLEVIRNIEIQEIVGRALKLNQGLESCEISVLFPEEKILLVHATPIIRNEATEGAVLVFHDITELRQLEKIRQDFVANVSHELRTPVSSIKGYAETLLEGALEDKKNAKEFLKIIHSDSDRLARLIDDLLDLSKIESGRLRMGLKPCATRPIVERVVSGLSRQVADKSIAITIDMPKDLSKIMADEARIAQVLLNLIDNAVKYTPREGKITISAKEKNVFVQIDVSDTGVGIPEKVLPRIFERFYRVDKARSRELGGTGLGLSIVKHIIQAHNGEVFVQSVEGQGSTFTFTIPKA